MSGITIFGSQLHTHLLGTRVVTQHFRGRWKQLNELDRDNHYSTHYQEIRLLANPVRVLPGDALLTTCWYDTTQRVNVSLGGFSISDEMCVNYVHYFPRINLEVCKSSIASRSLENYFHFLHKLVSYFLINRLLTIKKRNFEFKFQDGKDKRRIRKVTVVFLPITNRSIGRR